MKRSELDELDSCIDILAQGGSIEDCIARFPALSEEVKAILKIAYETMMLGEVKIPAGSLESSRSRFLDQATAYRRELENQEFGRQSLITTIKQKFSSSPSFKLLARRAILAIIITAALIVFSRGLMITSAKALPGDSLYPVKRAVENIQVYLITNQIHKLEHEENFNQERVGEVIRLINLKRTQQVSFEGVLDEKTTAQWNVSGIAVIINTDTMFIDGLSGKEDFVIGALVEVEGITTPMGGINASEIHLREYSFIGRVEKIDKNSWQIAGYKVPVYAGTKIENGIRIGDEVLVLVHSEDDGLFALSIQSNGTAEPLPTLPQKLPNTPIPEQGTAGTEQIDQQEFEPTLNPGQTQQPARNDQDEIFSTPEITGEENHEASSISRGKEDLEHEGDDSVPESRESPEQTETHVGEP